MIIIINLKYINNDLILQSTLLTSLEYTATKQCFVSGIILGLGDASIWINNGSNSYFIYGKHLVDSYDRLFFTLPLAKGHKLIISTPPNGSTQYYIFSSN